MKYDQAIADILCEAISEGEPLHKACKANGVKPREVHRWIADHEPDGTGTFKINYDIACKEREQHRIDKADELMNEALEIARSDGTYQALDENGVVRTHTIDVRWADLKIKTLHAQAAKLNPAKYSDRQTVQHAGHDGGPLKIADDVPREELIKEWRRLTAELQVSGIGVLQEPTDPTEKATIQ